MKKIFLSVLVLFLSQSFSAFASFNDVPTTHSEYKAINWLQEQGVVQGYSDGTFRPTQSVTRAEFLKMLFETAGMVGASVELPFTDIDTTQWYMPYLKEAYAYGIVNGYSDNTFKPNNNIAVSEALKIITNAFYFVDPTTSESPAFYGCSAEGRPLSSYDLLYKNVDRNAWYWKYTAEATNKCLLEFGLSAYGKNGLNIGAYITRGDMAEMLYRAKAVYDNSAAYYSDAIFPAPVEASDVMIEAFEYDKDLFDYYGRLNVTGYATVKEVPEAFCESNCETYDYVSFNIVETDAPEIFNYILENDGNAYLGEKSVGLGCIDGENIVYTNDSDEFGMKEYVLSDLLSSAIIGSSKSLPITIELVRYPLSAGAGAPTCYSHFTEVNEVLSM
jgi:hypothetical protein